MTEEEVSAFMWKLHGELKSLGIPVSPSIAPNTVINTRARRRLGCCIYRDGICTIEISQSLLGDPERVRETLIHELLHTCYGCRNHGARWQAYARQVNEAWGLSLERTAKPEEGETMERLRIDTVKYVLVCESCGAKILRTRMCHVVKTPWRYRCRCGGTLKRIL